MLSVGAPGYEVQTFNIGDVFRGSYKLSLDVSDTSPTPEIGHYVGAVTEVKIYIGDYGPATVQTMALQIGNDYGENAQDYYQIITWQDSDELMGEAVGHWEPKAFILQLVDYNAVAFTTDEIPPRNYAPDPGEFCGDRSFLQLTFRNKETGDTSAIVAIPTECVGAPEPSLVLTAPAFILGGDTVEFSWDTGTTDPFNCVLFGPAGVLYEFDPSVDGATGSYTSQPLRNKSIFTLQCTDPSTGAEYSTTATVEVIGGGGET